MSPQTRMKIDDAWKRRERLQKEQATVGEIVRAHNAWLDACGEAKINPIEYMKKRGGNANISPLQRLPKDSAGT